MLCLVTAFTIGGFGSVANLMIALENDEYIRGFVNGYMEYGEPYLRSSYGTMLCYWGGIGHYTMYLMMVAAIAWRSVQLKQKMSVPWFLHTVYIIPYIHTQLQSHVYDFLMYYR